MELIRGKELAQKILDQITAHPETHNQGTWADEHSQCGTTYCIAGWAVALNWGTGSAPLPVGARHSMARELGTIPHWGSLGQELLDLDEDTATDLFYSSTKEAPRMLAELFDLEYTEPGVEQAVCAGHALIRVYEAGAWYLACAYPECGHRILEGGVPTPPVQDIELPSVDPEETEAAA